MNTLSSSVLAAQAQTLQCWADQLDGLLCRVSKRFARPDARRHARSYVVGLLSPVERKNGWQLAEQAGYSTPYALQHLLDRARWDAELVRDDVRDYVVEHLGSEDAVLVLDETGFVKKGVKSCGVSRQYSGTAGRIENCQIGVFVGYASAKGHAFLDRALYLPDAWTEDLARCKAAEVPKDTAFATKPKLAKAMLERALSAKVPCRWVTGDSVYGKDSSLRLWLEEQGKAYVLAVTGHECACIGLERHPIKHLLPSVPDDGWHRLSAGAGS